MGLQWIEYLKQSGWMDLLKVGGVAGVVSSVVTLGWNELREARVSRRKARHVALTVALSLESYAREARSMMHRADWATEEAGRLQMYEPLRCVTSVRIPGADRLEMVETQRCLSAPRVSGHAAFDPSVLVCGVGIRRSDRLVRGSGIRMCEGCSEGVGAISLDAHEA